jgi:hypothetical protein
MTVLQSNAAEAEVAISHELGSITHASSHEVERLGRPMPIPVPIGATVEELERGILDAVRLGLADVARTLAGQLEDRKRALAPSNVVSLRDRR